ncbi:MAG: hypothetical protein RLZ40_398, partial [Actinomycetota bacterium]
MRRLVITRTLNVPVIAANTNSASACHHDDHDNVPKHASRTSSMQWYTGFTLLIVPNQ